MESETLNVVVCSRYLTQTSAEMVNKILMASLKHVVANIIIN